MCIDVNKQNEYGTRGVYDPHGITNMVQRSSEYVLDRDYAIAQADKEGLVVVEADDYTLQLDFDNEEAFNRFTDFGLAQLVAWVVVTRAWWTESKSGNKHVYVKMLSPRPLEERLVLQAALGSDGVREFLNLMRYEHNTDKPVLFFEKPDAVEHVIYATDGYQPQLPSGAVPKGLLTDASDDLDDIDFNFGALAVRRHYSGVQG